MKSDIIALYKNEHRIQKQWYVKVKLPQVIVFEWGQSINNSKINLNYITILTVLYGDYKWPERDTKIIIIIIE